jgi:hypothetical protein
MHGLELGHCEGFVLIRTEHCAKPSQHGRVNGGSCMIAILKSALPQLCVAGFCDFTVEIEQHLGRFFFGIAHIPLFQDLSSFNQ